MFKLSSSIAFCTFIVSNNTCICSNVFYKLFIITLAAHNIFLCTMPFPFEHVFLSASFFTGTTPVGLLAICSVQGLEKVFTSYIWAIPLNINRKKKMSDNLVIMQHLFI